MATMTTARCSFSGTQGKKVAPVTLHTLIKDEFLSQIADNVQYYFCDSKGCEVVYFTKEGQAFTKPQLKVEVGAKETSGERPLCYCFGHSVATIKNELLTLGVSHALEDVGAKMKYPGCHCATANPSGSCCLEAVKAGIQVANEEIAYGRTLTPGRHTDDTSTTADFSDKSERCNSDRPDYCQPEKSDTPKPTTQNSLARGPTDPDRLLVFRVEGLTCPAVKGIGCGLMLAPVLARLEQIEGVEESAANYTGTMIRISVAKATNENKVAEDVREVLRENESKPVALTGNEFKRPLEQEQWRATGRLWELSAIEYRTLIPHRITTFAKIEKFDKELTDKLLTLATEQLDRITKEAEKEKVVQPDDWHNWCMKSLTLFLERAQEVLTAEQLDRFNKSLTCWDEDPPEAPPELGGMPLPPAGPDHG